MTPYVDMLGFLNLPGPTPDVSSGNIARLHEARDSGLRVMHVTGAPPWCKGTMQAIQHLGGFKDAYERTGAVTTVYKTTGLEIALDKTPPGKCGKIGVIWGLQGCPVDTRGMFRGQVSMLYSAGYRIMGLAYDDETPFGCGWRAETTKRDTGLTKKGRDLISAMAEIGMILDLAHAGSCTALQAVDHAVKVGCRVFISHTGAYGVRKIKRNATDHVMRAVMEMDADGIVCCYLLTFGLARSGSSVDLINRHITTMCQLRGVDYVGMGTDGCAAGYQDRDAWHAIFDRLKDKLDPDDTFGARFPDQPDTPANMITPHRLVTLHEHLTDTCGRVNADKIMGGNALRFLRSALPKGVR